MVKTYIGAGGSGTTTANTTNYWRLGGNISANTTEASRSVLLRSAGTLTNLYVRVTANAIAGTSTVTTRKNGTTDGNNTVSIGSTATGEFTDSSNSDTVTAGDKWSYKFVPGAATNTLTFSILSCIFDATTDTVTRTIVSFNLAQTTASTTWFLPLSGHNGTATTTETNAKQRMRKAGTLKNFGAHITANRATTTTANIRKNGGNGNGAVSITGGGATGWYEDTGSTDTVSAGEDWNWAFTTGTGVDSITIQALSADFVSTNGDGLIGLSDMTPVSFTDNTVSMCHVSGDLVSVTSANEAFTKADCRIAGDYSELTCLVTQNDVNSASITLILRKNGADTALSASITANTTGVFSDSTNTVTLVSTDEINYQITVPSVSGTHTIQITNIVMSTHITVNQNYTRTMTTETVSISESLTKSFGAVRSMSTETVNISEAIARKLDAIRNPQETTAISESLTRMLSATRTLPETTTISEQLVKSKGQSRNPTENVTIGESLARMLAATRNPQETTAVSENLSRMLAANRTLSENTTISESLAAARLFIRSLATETVTVSDSISRMLAANRTLSDTVIVSDNLARMLAASRALTTETVAVSDSITRMLAATRTLSDTVSKGENLTRQLAASRSLATETTNITEQLNRMLAATRVISQTVSISEQLDFTYTAGGGGPTNYQRTITETTNISESLLRMLAATRALAAENTAISESLQRSVGRNRTINENVSIGESLTRKLDAFRTNIESTTIGESLNRMLAATRAIPTQTVSIGESLVKQLGATRTLIENTVSSDNLSRKLDAFRTLIETTSISDILDYVYGAVGARHYFVELIENVSISDSVRTWIEYLKIFPGKDAARQKVETVPDKRKSPNWWRSTWYTLTRKGRKGTSSLSSG